MRFITPKVTSVLLCSVLIVLSDGSSIAVDNSVDVARSNPPKGYDFRDQESWELSRDKWNKEAESILVDDGQSWGLTNDDKERISPKEKYRLGGPIDGTDDDIVVLEAKFLISNKESLSEKAHRKFFNMLAGYDYVIKYGSSCSVNEGLTGPSEAGLSKDVVPAGHPSWNKLVWEYLLLKTIDDESISPIAKALSRGTAIDASKHSRDKRFSPKGKKCSGGTFRGLVESRVGPTLEYFRLTLDSTNSEYFHLNKERMVQILSIGLRTVELLEQLHFKGFAHGNVNEVTVVFRKNAYNFDFTTKPDIVLVGFEYSCFYPENFGKTFMQPVSEKLLKFLPPWRLSGTPGRSYDGSFEARSPRPVDDLYQALELTARMLSPEHALDYLFPQHRNARDISDYKSELWFFKDYAKNDFFSGRIYDDRTLCESNLIKPAPLGKCAKAMNALSTAMRSLFRTVKNGDEKPNYTLVKKAYLFALCQFGENESCRDGRVQQPDFPSN